MYGRAWLHLQSQHYSFNLQRIDYQPPLISPADEVVYPVTVWMEPESAVISDLHRDGVGLTTPCLRGEYAEICATRTSVFPLELNINEWNKTIKVATRAIQRAVRNTRFHFSPLVNSVSVQGRTVASVILRLMRQHLRRSLLLAAISILLLMRTKS